jgi:hypothetical protein
MNETDGCTALDDTRFSKLVSLKGAEAAAAEAFGSDTLTTTMKTMALESAGCGRGFSPFYIVNLQKILLKKCFRKCHVSPSTCLLVNTHAHKEKSLQ